MPLFFAAARVLPRWINRAASGFAAVSYEFYILHFYFIGRSLDELFGEPIRVRLEILISFPLVLALATGLYFLDSRLRRSVDAYLLETRCSGSNLSAR
jgi:peptidoglycan/LPS O-acetylase OafA/YrhL